MGILPSNMEQSGNPTPIVQEMPTSVGAVGQPQKKKGGNKWLFIFLGLLILGGAGIFFFSSTAGDAKPTPTPSFGVLPVDDFTPEPVATPTAEPVDKESVTIEIQNGTGIAGEAGYLQGKLKALDFTKIEAGNASSTDHSDTTVTFKKGTSTTLQDEIKKELDGIYKKVVVKTSSTQDSDVVIITGLRSGQTAKPESTTAPNATTSASSTPTSLPTPEN